MVQDLTRRVHRPRKMDGPLLVADRPWEHIPYFGNYTWTILHDPDAGLFRCWHEDWALDPVGLASSTADITDPSISSCRLCYAVSQDGLNWEKPALDLVREDGHDTNIILGDSKDNPEQFGSVHSATIIDDARETDSSRRFKMLFQHITAGRAGRVRRQRRLRRAPGSAEPDPSGVFWGRYPLDHGRSSP